MSGTLNGRYRLARRIGSGGMGEVWQAQDELLQRPVAVKLLHHEPAATDTARSEAVSRSRFEREARLTARLSGHPNVVLVHDYGHDVDSGALYTVMELIPGPSLSAVLRTHAPLPTVLAITWAAQACRGLAAAHATGVVHRDVKPGNLVLSHGVVSIDDPGQLKVVDFGIAGLNEAATRSQRLTQTCAVIGTPSYMSPERIQGLSVGPESDLYAIGAVLHEMVLGRPPFVADTPHGILQQHLSQPPESLRASRPDLPAGLDDLVLQLLEKAPERRPKSAQSVVAQLEQLRHAAQTHQNTPDSRPTARTGTQMSAERSHLDQRLADLERRLDEGSFAAAAHGYHTLTSETERVFGSSAPETLRVRRRHAYASGKAGHPQRAAHLFGELAGDLARVYSPDHAETLTARYYRAVNLSLAGDPNTAAGEQATLLDDLCRSHGPDSRMTLLCRLRWAVDIGAGGQPQRAVVALEELSRDLDRVLGPEDKVSRRARGYLEHYARSGRADTTMMKPPGHLPPNTPPPR
ncbi:serine/threonine-protein kinase [Lipingzhangella sp. LS1_29]|uniref:Serine/threonine-protein kinase n=1 Tax=Lipingzhangella rawalii TaxID=2055835 RepID=A0ABU2H2M9_9ACTN|nr:serine/threonine-protein kinase [Lipingzhangella rawalii]MDS1268879.1 serine/threonine-protein kinase [Lipingzhangella rawalii]